MAEYMIVPTDSIDDTADAIKAKLGTQTDLEWGQDGFASYVEDIPSGYSIDSVVTGNFSGAITISSSSITHGDFHGCPITSISAPNAISMALSYDYNKLFCKDCTSLVSLSFPLLQTLTGSRYAFYNTRVVSLSLPEVLTMTDADYFMQNNTALTSVSIPKATSFSGNAAFKGCTSLETVEIGGSNTANRNSVFEGCSSLRTVKYYGGTDIGNDTFRYCIAITSLALPKATILGSYCFGGCTALTALDLLAQNRIDQNCFNGCSSLKTLVIRKTSVATLNNVNAFVGTPFASGGTGGTIYIPKTLYDALGTGTNDYKAASNWSTIDGYGTITWAQIEGSYYETHYADGTIIPT